jgi:hypothetical protein
MIFLLMGDASLSGTCHIRPMATTYRILHPVPLEEAAMYKVETTEVDGTVRLSNGFTSQAEAEAWIAEQRKMADAADRFDRQAPRNWRD